MPKKRRGFFKSGLNNVNYKLEERIRAKALYIDSQGSKPLYKIAEEVKVTSDTVSKWKKEGDWDADLNKFQEEVQKKVNEKLLVSRECHGLLGDVTEDQITNAVMALVGKSVGEAVSDFLTKIHRQDLKDISDLNKAIQHHLKQGTIEWLKPTDINNLVNAKASLIKAVRLIFGVSTGEGASASASATLELTITDQQAQYLANAGVISRESFKENVIDITP